MDWGRSALDVALAFGARVCPVGLVYCGRVATLGKVQCLVQITNPDVGVRDQLGVLSAVMTHHSHG